MHGGLGQQRRRIPTAALAPTATSGHFGCRRHLAARFEPGSCPASRQSRFFCRGAVTPHGCVTGCRQHGRRVYPTASLWFQALIESAAVERFVRGCDASPRRSTPGDCHCKASREGSSAANRVPIPVADVAKQSSRRSGKRPVAELVPRSGVS